MMITKWFVNNYAKLYLNHETLKKLNHIGKFRPFSIVHVIPGIVQVIPGPTLRPGTKLMHKAARPKFKHT